MPVYVVAYDLTRPGQNYPDLWDALKELDGKRLLESTWAVHARGPADALLDHLAAHIDSTDRMLVIDRDSGNFAGRRLKTKLSDF